MSLWDVPAYLDYVQAPLTPETVASAQDQLGVTLPAAYLELVQIQNGGQLRATWPGLPHGRLNGIGPDFPSILRDPWWRGPDADPDQWAPDKPELLIAFDGGGHWDLCFDYRACGPHGRPAVAYIDNDAEQDTPVADSFDSFLAGLVDELERDAIRVYDDVDLDTYAAGYAAANGGRITDQGDWNHGYRQLFIRTRTGLAWLSHNRVPAGFRRDGDEIITTPEQALRIPSDPACRLVMVVSEPV